MTAPARQQQHCDHECICMKYSNTNAYGYPCTHNKEPTSFTVNSPCEHDTRATHTSPPAPDIDALKHDLEFKQACIENQKMHINTLNAKMAEMMQAAAKAERDRGVGSLLEELRNLGWMVAIHNDYWQDGKYYTFWLMTNRSGLYFKGESSMEHGGDIGALNQIKNAIEESLRAQKEKTCKI